MLKIYQKHSDLIGSLTTLTLNGVIFVSKITKKIPPLFPRVSQVFLCYVGLFSLNIQWRDLCKSAKDFKEACKEKECVAILQTAAKTYVKGCDILLQVSFSLAAVSALFGNTPFALALFAIGRPFAITSFVLAVIGDVYDWVEIRRLEKMAPQEMSPHILRVLDLYTFENRGEKTPMELILQMKRTQELNFGMIFLGWGALGALKSFPNTKLSAGVNFSMSLLFTIKLCWQKFF
jgi:hypothetical protein